ncbi:MAG: CHAT domain-containing protein [Prochloraceae cyanobacterium]|nr:CHAT domain-containing protein [Prochloraceae cyanobacterium]
MKTITKEQVLNLLRKGTSIKRLEFLNNLPPNSFKEAAASLIVSNNPTVVILALTSLILEYCQGKNPEYGAILAEAVFERANEIWKTVQNHGLEKTTFSNLAYSHVKALSLLGYSEEVIKKADQYIEFLEKLEETEGLTSLKVLKIEALINLKEIDEAEKELQDDSLFENPISGIEAERLKGWIDQFKIDATTLRSQAKHSPEPPSPKSLLDIMKAAIDLGFEGEAGRSLKQQVDQLNLDNSISSIIHKKPAEYNQEDIEKYSRMLEALNQGEEFLGKEGNDSELSVGGKIRNASAIFVRGKIRNASAIFVRGTPAPDVIRDSLSVLKSSLEWANQHGITELENDALWGIYLCNSRLNQPSEAADALIQLRGNLEGMRRGIKEPLKRGGIFSTYPYLFNALCEHLQKAGRAEDLLEAIESSKGRVIADRLTEQSDAIVSDKAIYESVKRLRDLTQSKRFHYLTYFVDEERVYASFVSKQGKVYAIDPVPIKNSVLQNAAKNVDPKNWGNPIPSPRNPRAKIPNVSDCLAPLVVWLENLLKQGIIQKDDHICYSSDEDFNNVPLQYLRFKDGILLDWFSLSRVHSVFHLDLVLRKKISSPSTQYLGVVVPRLQEYEGKKEFVANLDAPIQWLEEHGCGHSIRLTDATLDRVTIESLDHRIVHFSTHGHFPVKGNPYHDSFLLLADEQGLPDKKQKIEKLKGKLTPKVILEEQLNLQDSCVSLMACVSGLAKEGIAGDTLGLDWAFIQAGASSLISTHWEVTPACAAQFFIRFYEKWIQGKQSRASAYRETTLELLNQNYTPDAFQSCTRDALQRWAAFSLTGDFR